MATDNRARVHAVFMGFSQMLADEIMGKLQTECDGVELVGGEVIGYRGKDSMDYARQTAPGAYADDKQSNAVLRKIASGKSNLDGLVLFFGGHCDKRFLLTGLPMLLVDYDAFPALQIGFKNALSIVRSTDARFLTASLSDTDVSKAVSEARLLDLTEKLNLFKVLSRMKDTTILDVESRGCGTEPHEHWWRLDEERYLHELKELLGTDAVIVDYRDLFKGIDQVGEQEARRVAARWIREAVAVKDGRTEDDVIDTARLYLATKRMMANYNANAVTADCMTWHIMGGEYDICGSLGLTEFQKDGIPAVAESDMDGLVTDILGNYLTGGQGFLGDFMIDVFNGTTVYAHCQAPVNPHGDDRAPYTIREHSGRTVLQVKLPTEGEITAMRVNLLERRISLHTGMLTDGEAVYRDFGELSCRTKLVAKADAKRIHSHYDYRTFTNHQVVYYGDQRARVGDLASLIGFEVVEEDR